MNTLRVTCSGYLNYIIGVREMYICALDVPFWKHSYTVWVNGQAIDLLGSKMAVDMTDGPLTRAEGAFQDGLPTDGPGWYAVDMIPTVEDRCSGVRLAPDWQKRPALAGVLHLSNGRVSALPRTHTTDKIWSWQVPGGRLVRQVIADALLFESHQLPADAKLRLVSREDEAPKDVPLIPDSAGVVHIAVISAPERWPDCPTPAENFALDLSHIAATLSLTNAVGKEVCWAANPDSTPPPVGNLPQFPDNPHGRLSVHVLRPGTPNCGAARFGIAAG